MIRDKILSLISCFLLSLLLSFAGAACIASAFVLEGNLLQLFYYCIASSFLVCVCYHFKADLVVPIAFAVLTFVLYRYFELSASVKALLNCVSTKYDKAYGWGILQWDDLQSSDTTVALEYIATIVCISTAWTTSGNRSSAWAIAAGLLCLVPCTINLSTVPSTLWLILWLAAVLLLLLTGNLRKQDVVAANKLTVIFAVPVMLFLVLLFRFAPKEGYERQKFADNILTGIEQMFFYKETEKTVDLESVGRKSASAAPVMDIWATKTGTYYLRGYAYDTYTGTHWTDSGQNIVLSWPKNIAPAGSLTIQTKYVENVLYMPYYSTLFYTDNVSAGVKNTQELTKYSFDFYSIEGATSDALYLTGDQMLQLPDETKQWAQAFLNKHNLVTVGDIYNFVQNFAPYDLNTPRMNESYTDFARWFLKTADSGYCIHFATAATVLLRAAGIPSRYVTGYVMHANGNTWATVRQENAHAWVEWYSAEYGWQIFDATPEEEEVEESTTPASESEPNTEPTKPTESSTATSKTEPTTEKAHNSQQDETIDESEAQNSTVRTNYFKTILLYVLLAAAFIGLLIAQWKIRVFLRERRQNTLDCNQKAIRYWKDICRFSKILSEETDPTLYKLAQEAKFSNHKLTRMDLKPLEAKLDDCYRKLHSLPIYRRVYHRLILALY